MKLERLDHLVLTVRSIAVTCEFYARVLGMEAITFGEGRTALRFGRQKINLHELGREFDPKAAHPGPGTADLCFITLTPLAEVVAHLGTCGVSVEEGPGPRTGAQSTLESVYIRDPDENLIEISNEVG